MSIHANLYTYLTAQSALTDLIGTTTAPGPRIFPITAPTDALFPYITFQRITSSHVQHTTAAAGLAVATFQFDVWDDDSVGCAAVAEALRGELEGYQTTAWSGVAIRGVYMQGQSDEFIPPTDSTEVGVYRTRQDYTIWYAESVPTF